MSKNTKQSSSDLGSKAAQVLQDPNASATARSLAASVLSQRAEDRQTGAEMEALAGRVLRSEKYSDQTRELAASVVSQANKER